jgi:ABC-2 type transport system ATP-binding protein
MIKINALKRSYADILAIDGVSFTIEKGEIAGLLGHNGAGKTTIMKMISGYLEPDSGQIEIDGKDIAQQRSEVQRGIGYLPESLPIYPEMSVADYLDYAASLKGLSRLDARDEIRRAVKETGISDRLLAPIATLSRGYKQRVGVAQAILGRPGLLILDEPTNGLDPTQTQQMRDLIKALARDATIILSTHIMQEVDAVCDRVLILRAGELAFDARLDELRGNNHLIVKSDIELTAACELLLSLDGVIDLGALAENCYQLTVDQPGRLAEISSRVAQALVEANHRLYELKPEQRDLESLFREVNEQAPGEVCHAA